MVYFIGVISNFVSYVCKVATGRYGPSLGAVSIFHILSLPPSLPPLFSLSLVVYLIKYFLI